MGRVKPKSKKKNQKNRNIWVIVFMVIVLAVVGLMVYNPHPGYSRLEKELDSIELPEGWTEVGPRTGEKDYWNLFCRDVTIRCPSISTVLKIDISDNTLSDLSYKLQAQGYSEIINNSECISKDENCTLRMIKADTVISLSIRQIQGKGISGYLYVRKN